jgi:hypothetical protein
VKQCRLWKRLSLNCLKGLVLTGAVFLSGTDVEFSGTAVVCILDDSHFPLPCCALRSWTVPISFLLVLPIGIFGAALATWSRGLYNEVYFQIGFLTTLGLTTKNAILIAHFAKEQNGPGGRPYRATTEAARLRLARSL